ncbi:CD2 antigen cytoplasmic tail-binding protein 2 homolog isoform X2 [Uranotaenia lowii]|uniref:CD2 antigen cytoplasmic tail-binding protein 2 homolog isoform X2 n=1 Tax=Uranotaenia lowii TaxID=190385 RepID=UPI002479965C|nr:CD2 antigen cytoplasmic tail-binding protein 2 homolog isoform X2 [Uranotaenia lowii]
MKRTAATMKPSEYNVLDDNDLDGQEDGVARVDGEMKFTPFNMKEEMEEGHFDADGHYLWKKGAEIRDNWLDNIDWVKIKNDPNYKEDKDKVKGLADSDSDDDDDNEKEKSQQTDCTQVYQSILEMMEPKETIKKALQRIGKKTAKLTTAQRWKMKKAGTLDDSSEKVTKLTELANELLTRNGNMDIYEETYEQIQKKINKAKPPNQSVKPDEELDMYADDFDSKEKDKLKDTDGTEPVASASSQSKASETTGEVEAPEKTVLMWEYKDQQNGTEIHGPFTTEQMQKFVDEGRLVDGAFVRKVGDEDTRFYSAARIDFELYL